MQCSNLTLIDFRNANFGGITDYTNMFNGVPIGTTIYVKDSTQKTWIEEKFTTLTGVTIPSN